jgi:hypothetical protein
MAMRRTTTSVKGATATSTRKSAKTRRKADAKKKRMARAISAMTAVETIMQNAAVFMENKG